MTYFETNCHVEGCDEPAPSCNTDEGKLYWCGSHWPDRATHLDQMDAIQASDADAEPCAVPGCETLVDPARGPFDERPYESGGFDGRDFFCAKHWADYACPETRLPPS